MTISDYRKLEIWQLSINMVKEVYSIINELPSSEKYGLSDQMRRSAISIPSNIAEGHGRNSPKEFVRFLLIAKGSINELETQLILCCELGLLEGCRCNSILDMLQSIGKMIYRLINYIENSNKQYPDDNQNPSTKIQRPKSNNPQPMNIIKTDIEGVVIIEPRIFNDARGYFFESYSKREFDEKVRPVDFVQDNESCSTKGVMRGLHFQRPPYAQSKLVRCVRGAVLDVAVDIRKGSPTYGKHVSCLLTEENHRQFFIPRGFAHGFAVLSDVAVFQYKCDNYYHPEADGGISITDPSLGIDWGIALQDAILSEKDTRHPLLADFDSPF